MTNWNKKRKERSQLVSKTLEEYPKKLTRFVTLLHLSGIEKFKTPEETQGTTKKYKKDYNLYKKLDVDSSLLNEKYKGVIERYNLNRIK